MYTIIDRTDNRFSDIVNREIYVDKTGLLKKLNVMIEGGNKPANCISVSRPVGFGKSTAVEMIKAYYSCARNMEQDLFKSFAIAKAASYREHLHKYHVLSINMDYIMRHRNTILPEEELRWAMNTFGDDQHSADEWHPAQLLEYLILQNLKDTFPVAVKSSCRTVSEALYLIGQRSERRFVLIIDNWEAVIRHEPANKELTGFYCWYLRDLIRRFNEKGALALGYITGVLPFPFAEGSGEEEYVVDSMIWPGFCAPYFGFTGKEALKLYERYSRVPSNAGNKEDDRESVYRFRCPDRKGKLQKMRMYNARDVIRRCLPQCGIPEWSDTNMLDHVWNLISANRDSFDPEFGRLFDGKKVVMELLPETEMYPGIVHPADLYYMEDVFSLMVHAGYLGYSNWKLYIPGKRIREYLTLRYHIETDAKAAS